MFGSRKTRKKHGVRHGLLSKRNELRNNKYAVLLGKRRGKGGRKICKSNWRNAKNATEAKALENAEILEMRVERNA